METRTFSKECFNINQSWGNVEEVCVWEGWVINQLECVTSLHA